MSLSNEESRRALLGAVSRALDSYEAGKLNPLLISPLLEQLQVVLEAVVAEDEPQAHETRHDMGLAGSSVADRVDGDTPRSDGGGSAAGFGSMEQRTWQQVETELMGLKQENQQLHRQVAELHAAVRREQERADVAVEAAAAAPGPLRLSYGGGGEVRRSQDRGAMDLGPQRLSSEGLKQQLADSRMEMAMVACRPGGPSRAEAVLMGELEQHRQVAASLRRELQKVAANAAREKEALSHEVRHWQLAANQAASVAERAQQKMVAAEQRLEAQVLQLRNQARELGVMQQQLAATRAALAHRTSHLERLDKALLQPLLAWHAEVDPAVVPALVAGMGVTRASQGSSPTQSGTQVPAAAGAVSADVEPILEHQIKAAVSAFEVLRSTAQQARSATEQLQAALDAKGNLLEALTAEKIASERRANEALRLVDVEAHLTMQVQELVSELTRVRLESAQAIKAAQEAAEEAQAESAAAAFERGRQIGDRQAAVAVAALRGELQDHEKALQRERELCERAVMDARRASEVAAEQAKRAGEIAVDQARREGELAAEQARKEGQLAVLQARQEGVLAVEEARLKGEAALRKARSEWERAVEEARKHAAAAEEAVRREAAEARDEREADLQRMVEQAEGHAASLKDQLQRTEERAAEALARCEQYLQQVCDLTKELEQARKELAEKDAAAAAAAKENEAATAKLEARLCESLQLLATQAEQLEEYANQHDSEQARSMEPLRSHLAHVSEERDVLHTECMALRQQLSAVQAAASGVEVEMDAMASALESHKAARSSAEAAADEARRAAAAATAAAEEAVSRVATLTQQLQETEIIHEREMRLVEARCAANLDAAQARYQAELEALQARLKMLRLKQSRVMAYVDDVFTSEEQEQGQQLHHQHQAHLVEQDRDQSPRLEQYHLEQQRERALTGLTAQGRASPTEIRWTWQQQQQRSRMGPILERETGMGVEESVGELDVDSDNEGGEDAGYCGGRGSRARRYGVG
ncbi:hypothetical protein Vretimale_10625 [Volvox reticuliferus]|uniref:Uncharacterized protein n=2 Tax=Volvox reticuliferus TaxID=1737510 RepID=A0A8J4CNS8_9CHLO|nr:hypothetical protein Vretifemale_13953 [Volvox reticuliferus]GIM06282.1 hypothetical protein Vretimale_10625 [Volvox reticuliferus]